MLQPDPVGGLYQPHAWIFPYMLDWGACGPQVKHGRLWATVLRWYDGAARVRAFTHGLLWIRDEDRITDPRHVANVNDLFDADVELGPYIPAGPFCVWLLSLDDGDLISGGPTSQRVDPQIVEALPGYAWALDRWRKVAPSFPFPYPFWLWPAAA